MHSTLLDIVNHGMFVLGTTALCNDKMDRYFRKQKYVRAQQVEGAHFLPSALYSPPVKASEAILLGNS
jgi:hypothetical protein